MYDRGKVELVLSLLAGGGDARARAEGFFGLLKQEFLYAADWTGASLEETSWGSWTPGCAGSARGAYPRRSAGSRPTSTGSRWAMRCRYKKSSTVPLRKRMECENIDAFEL